MVEKEVVELFPMALDRVVLDVLGRKLLVEFGEFHEVELGHDSIPLDWGR